MNTEDGPTLIAFDGSAAARQAVATAAALLKPRATLVLTVWEAALAQTAVASPPDVAMTPVVDPAAMLTFDEALRGHADRVAKLVSDRDRQFFVHPLFLFLGQTSSGKGNGAQDQNLRNILGPPERGCNLRNGIPTRPFPNQHQPMLIFL